MSKNLDKKIGAVLVQGGGIAGVQASLDLANSGFKVYLVERDGAIGGMMAHLDKTFPTGDCATCIVSLSCFSASRFFSPRLKRLRWRAFFRRPAAACFFAISRSFERLFPFSQRASELLSR